MATDQQPDFAARYANLASPRLGSEVAFATDDFFAPRERLIADSDPVFIAGKYDENGKWMDGWETRRRRDGGHDWCLVRLGVRGIVRGVDIDTRHFTGNFPPSAGLEGCLSDGEPGDGAIWTPLVPVTRLGPDAHHYVGVEHGESVNWLRLRIFPDGGVARLRVYGEPRPDWSGIGADEPVELSGLANGGRIVACNDAHYGTLWSLLGAGRAASAGDGWETRRRRRPGNDWIIIALGYAGLVERIEVDTGHFKGNYPDMCSVLATHAGDAVEDTLVAQSMFWDELMAPRKLGADEVHRFGPEALSRLGPVTHIRLNIFPDGGVSRFRVFGTLAR